MRDGIDGYKVVFPDPVPDPLWWIVRLMIGTDAPLQSVSQRSDEPPSHILDMSDAPQPLQFESFTSAVDTTFWHALSSHKLDVQRLDSAALPLNGTYGPGRVVDATDGAGNTAATPLHARLSVFGGAAFDSAPPEEPDSDVVRVTGARPRWTPLEFDAPGVLYNTNTQEEFKTLDKNALLKEAGNKARKSGSCFPSVPGLISRTPHQLWRTIIDAPWTILRNPSKLSPFIMLTHADLKRFKYYFWFGFPALLPATQYTVTSSSLAKDVWPTEDLKDLRSQFLEHRRRTSHGDTAFFIVRRRVSDRHAGSNIAVGHLGDWEAFSTSLTSGDEV